MKELTEEEATAFFDKKTWEKLSMIERAWFQLYQPFLAMPFGIFQDAVEKLLDRPVWSHEFAFLEQLRKEAITKQKITFEQVLNKWPRDKNLPCEGCHHLLKVYLKPYWKESPMLDEIKSGLKREIRRLQEVLKSIEKIV